MSWLENSSLASANFVLDVLVISVMVAASNMFARTKYVISLSVLLRCYGDVPLGHCARWATLIGLGHPIITCWQAGKSNLLNIQHELWF